MSVPRSGRAKRRRWSGAAARLSTELVSGPIGENDCGEQIVAAGARHLAGGSDSLLCVPTPRSLPLGSRAWNAYRRRTAWCLRLCNCTGTLCPPPACRQGLCRARFQSSPRPYRVAVILTVVTVSPVGGEAASDAHSSRHGYFLRWLSMNVPISVNASRTSGMRSSRPYCAWD